jgi:lipoic acid synthetase
MRVRARFDDEYIELKKLVRDQGLPHSVRGSRLSEHLRVLGRPHRDVHDSRRSCTRACGFCQVDTRKPLAVDADEPRRVAEAVHALGLAHAVITCVARDDLPDGGASIFAPPSMPSAARSPVARSSC